MFMSEGHLFPIGWFCSIWLGENLLTSLVAILTSEGTSSTSILHNVFQNIMASFALIMFIFGFEKKNPYPAMHIVVDEWIWREEEAERGRAESG